MTQAFYIIRGFGQAYGSGAYGSCNYQDSTSCATTGSSTSSSSGSGALTNTGIMVSAIVGLACLAIFIALLVRFWRRPAKDEATQAQQDDGATSDQQDDGSTHSSIDE